MGDPRSAEHQSIHVEPRNLNGRGQMIIHWSPLNIDVDLRTYEAEKIAATAFKHSLIFTKYHLN